MKMHEEGTGSDLETKDAERVWARVGRKDWI